MRLVKEEKLNREIKETFDFVFESANKGIFLIEILASAKSWWQNLKGLRSFFKDDDITLSLDSVEIFTSNSKDGDVRTIWNGNELKSLSKTVLIATKLDKGKHSLTFQPDKSPYLESIRITELEGKDADKIIYVPATNNPPEKGDRRPWISYFFLNLAVKELSILAKANKEGGDDQDIKLIIDGKTEVSDEKNSHKDWFWCGKVLKGNEKEFKKELNLDKGKHFIEFWADKCPYLKKIEVSIALLDDNISEGNDKVIKPYTCGGVGCREDYNRYDEMISEVVSYWNNEFLRDTDPPDEPLDPNLVKAMMYQESRVGFDKTAGVNVMQVGNEGDPSVLTLRGELLEYWIHDKKTIPLKYDAKVESVKDSVNWGVRWLYHKAQGSTKDKKRYWIPWREAVIKYGPPKEGYINSVWDIYKKGIKNDKKLGTIRLWSIILIVMMLFLNGSTAYSLENKIKDQIVKGQSEQPEGVELVYSQDKKYFLVQIEWEKDWWEELKIGRVENKSIKWLRIDKPPGEQAILSGRFISLKGFANPLVEVYGLTHVGHGFLYIYEIRDDELNLLFKTAVVDYNSDIRWAPGNYERNGYENCGEVFSNGKLVSEYGDINQDGAPDVLLSGVEEVVCEKEDKNHIRFDEIKVDSHKVEKVFLWDKNEQSWVTSS